MKLMELYQDKLIGAISGWDRIRFRGTIRWLANKLGLEKFLGTHGILLKDFTAWATCITESIRADWDQQANRLGIETRYLNSGNIDKEQLVREIALAKGITAGPICNLSVLETCHVPQIKGNKSKKIIELRIVPSKCIHLYHYFDHPDYGFGHVRMQTWAPYNIFICLNGRHWLERQLQKHQVAYVKDGNCFPWIEDVALAQQLADQQLNSQWSQLLDRLVRQACPSLLRILPLRPDYYWSAEETEWATDLMFRSVSDVEVLYPEMVYHALRISDSPAVMKYFGRRCISRSGQIKGRAPEEVVSDYRRFYPGVRLKHWLNHNSIKMYNKSGSLLRIETTINNSRDFKVFRFPDDAPNGKASWQPMRKGVSDLYRRSQVSQQCNERYGDALAAMQVAEKLKEVVGTACDRVRKDKRSYRGLNPWQTDDYRMLTFLAQGQWAIRGFRNREMREWLYPESRNRCAADQKRDSGKVTRRIALLRAHGLVKKVAKENRYMLTGKGQKFVTGLLAASDVDIKRLTEMVA